MTRPRAGSIGSLEIQKIKDQFHHCIMIYVVELLAGVREILSNFLRRTRFLLLWPSQKSFLHLWDFNSRSVIPLIGRLRRMKECGESFLAVVDVFFAMAGSSAKARAKSSSSWYCPSWPGHQVGVAGPGRSTVRLAPRQSRFAGAWLRGLSPMPEAAAAYLALKAKSHSIQPRERLLT